MMKTVKGKIVTGVVAVGLLSGVGAAFADTNAGQALQNWYDSQFKTSSTSIATSATNHVKGKVGSLTTEYKNLKSSVTSQINGESDSQVTAKTSTINGKKAEYVKQVTDKKTIISDGMEAQFRGIKAYADGLIEKGGKDALNYANRDLTKQAGKDGAAAITNMDTRITAAKDQAKSELDTAITNAKHDLTVQLAGETNKTTQDINNAIDAKIVELRGLINQRVQELVQEQQALIQAQATVDEQAAMDELDGVVQGI